MNRINKLTFGTQSVLDEALDGAMKNTYQSIRNSTWYAPASYIGAAINNSVSMEVGGAVWASIFNPIRINVKNSVREEMYSTIFKEI